MREQSLPPFFFQVSAGSLGTTRFTMNPSAGRRVKKLEPLKLEPRLIGGLNTTLIKKVACGDMFTACLTGKTCMCVVCM